MEDKMMMDDKMSMKKNNTTKIVAIIIGLVVLAGIVGYSIKETSEANKKADETTAMKKKEETAAMKKKEEDAAMKKKDEDTAMKKKDEEAAMKKKEADAAAGIVTAPTTTPAVTTKAATKPAVYTDYSADKVSAAATDGTALIFFHAPWCPTCKASEAAIKGNESKLTAGTTILKTDYDTSTELKKKYGITTQSTWVKVDKDGNLIKKTNDLTTIDLVNTFTN
jgi:thiol-disulfide isomerase/thioredoxin